MAEKHDNDMILITADEQAAKIAKEIIKLMKKENLTYRRAVEVLAICEEALKDVCAIGN